ncbi:MAG: hypothetical protein AAGI88_25365 [Pseudomonadota bacterium]
MKAIQKLMGVFVVLAICSGCSHVGNVGQYEQRSDNHRVRNVVLAVGAAIVIGAIAANSAQNNVRDALSTPQ